MNSALCSFASSFNSLLFFFFFFFFLFYELDPLPLTWAPFIFVRVCCTFTPSWLSARKQQYGYIRAGSGSLTARSERQC
jgi:hypothetical protein